MRRRVELVFDGAKERNNSFFVHLLSKRAEIEQAFGSSLDWRRMEDNKADAILPGVSMTAGIDGDTDASYVNSDRLTRKGSIVATRFEILL